MVGGRRDREIFLKKIETDEVKRGELSMCVCMHVHARVHGPPPQSSKSQGRLIAFQG